MPNFVWTAKNNLGQPIIRKLAAILFALALSLTAHSSRANPSDYFGIQVVDEQTGRGVPMVELKTTSDLCYYTDSAGYAAFNEPGLMNRAVWFDVSSHGYEYPADAFGERGAKLETRPGSTARIKIKRLNIAERLYRITGEGIYRDSVLLGHTPPIDTPLLNAEVTGQDTILNAIYHGKLFWFYGDTMRASYALGNYSITGATTPLADQLDPSAGFVLRYFAGKDGFARPMAPMQGKGVVWIGGLVVLPDGDGRERMLAHFDRRHGLGQVFETGFVEYNDEKDKFEKCKDLPIHQPFPPTGCPFPVRGGDGVNYMYFTAPFPVVRVKADRASYLDPSNYESYTCFKPGEHDELDRGAGGKLIWAWKKNTTPLSPRKQEELVKSGRMRRDESPFRLEDPDSGKEVLLAGGSCNWNAWRKRYVIIASQNFGATMLGEIWYSEAERLEGPWTVARKIITHANKSDDAHDFYNPTQHPFFDQDGGRVIYLEGTYVNTFSGNHRTTPLYEYNQIMYRLDLSDPRLKLQ